MSMRLSWSTAAILRSESSESFERVSIRSFPTSSQILINLNNLKFDLGDFALGLRDHPRQLTALAFQTSTITLQRVEPRYWHEILLPQAANTFQFAKDEIDLLLLGLGLPRVTFDLILKLRPTFLKLRLLPISGLASKIE